MPVVDYAVAVSAAVAEIGPTAVAGVVLFAALICVWVGLAVIMALINPGSPRFWRY